MAICTPLPSCFRCCQQLPVYFNLTFREYFIHSRPTGRAFALHCGSSVFHGYFFSINHNLFVLAFNAISCLFCHLHHLPSAHETSAVWILAQLCRDSNQILCWRPTGLWYNPFVCRRFPLSDLSYLKENSLQ